MHVVEGVAADGERAGSVAEQHADIDVAESVAAHGAVDVAEIEDQRDVVVVAGNVGPGVTVEGVAGEGHRRVRGIVGIADRLEQRAGISCRIEEIVREGERLGLGQVEIVAAVAAGRQLEHAVGERQVGVLLAGVAGDIVPSNFSPSMTTEPVVVSVTALPAAQDSTVSAPRVRRPVRPALAPTIVSALSMVRFSL